MSTSEQQFRALLAFERDRLEEHRSRMATKMHDDISQTLTVLTMEMALLQNRLGESHPETVKINELLNLIGGLNQAVRRITAELRPKILDEFGLIAAMQYECRRLTAETGVSLVLDKDFADLSLSSQSKTNEIFRLFQELVSFVIHQHRTAELRVGIEFNDGKLLLILTESGSGIWGEILENDCSLDLLVAQERAHAIGGTLHLLKDSEGSLQVTFTLPIRSGEIKVLPNPSQQHTE